MYVCYPAIPCRPTGLHVSNIHSSTLKCPFVKVRLPLLLFCGGDLGDLLSLCQVPSETLRIGALIHLIIQKDRPKQGVLPNIG